MDNVILSDTFFRTLSDNEESEFVKWAQQNNTPEHRAKAGLYHPVVRAAWAVMDALGIKPEDDSGADTFHGNREPGDEFSGGVK